MDENHELGRQNIFLKKFTVQNRWPNEKYSLSSFFSPTPRQCLGVVRGTSQPLTVCTRGRRNKEPEKNNNLTIQNLNQKYVPQKNEADVMILKPKFQNLKYKVDINLDQQFDKYFDIDLCIFFSSTLLRKFCRTGRHYDSSIFCKTSWEAINIKYIIN